MSGQHGILSEKKDNRFQKELNSQKYLYILSHYLWDGHILWHHGYHGSKFLDVNKLNTSVQNIKLLKTLFCHTWRRPVAIKVWTYSYYIRSIAVYHHKKNEVKFILLLSNCRYQPNWQKYSKMALTSCLFTHANSMQNANSDNNASLALRGVTCME